MADATLTVDAEDRATAILNHIHSSMLDMIEIADDVAKGFKNVYQEMDKLAVAEHKRQEASKKARAAEAQATKIAVAEINQEGRKRLQESKQVHDLERDQQKQAGKESLEVTKANLTDQNNARKHARLEESAVNEAARDRERQANLQAGAERIERIKQDGKAMVALIRQETQDQNAERRSGLSAELKARQRLHKEERASVKSAANEERGIRKAILDEEIQAYQDQSNERAAILDEQRKEAIENVRKKYRQEKAINDQARKDSLSSQKQAQEEEYRQLLLAQERELNALKLAGKEFKDEEQRRHAEQRQEMKIAQREARQATSQHYDAVEDEIRQQLREANAIAKAEYDRGVDIVTQAYKEQKRETIRGTRALIREKKQAHQLANVEAKVQDDEILALMDRRHAEELDEIKHADRMQLEELKASHKRERDEYIEFSRELRDERLQGNRKELLEMGQHYKELNREAEQAWKRDLLDRKEAYGEAIAENEAYNDEQLARNNHARLLERQNQKHEQDMEMERFEQHNREKIKKQKQTNNRLLDEQSGYSKKFMKLMAATFSLAGISLAAHKIREFTSAIVDSLVTFEGMKLSLVAVEGSAERMAQQLLRIREIAKLPGVELESAIKTTVTLRALKLEADLVERSVVAIGNALAILGREGELGGVTLAISQILGKGKIQAEEINQIAERMPFIRGILVDEFGTANTEILQKMEINTSRFIEKITEGLEKLPKVATTIGTSLKNMRNEWFVFRASLGTLLKPSIMTAIEGATALLNRANEALDRANKNAEEKQQKTETATKARGIVEGMGMGDVQPFSDYLRTGMPTNIDEVRRQLEQEQASLDKRLSDDYKPQRSAKVNRPISAIRKRITELQGQLDSMLAFQNPVHLTISELEEGVKVLQDEIDRQEGLSGTRIGHGTSKLRADTSVYVKRLTKAYDLFYWTLYGKTAKGGMAELLERERKKVEAAALELQLYNERMAALMGDKLLGSVRGAGFLGKNRRVMITDENLPQIVTLDDENQLEKVNRLIDEELQKEIKKATKNKAKIVKEIDPGVDKILDTDKRKERRDEVFQDYIDRLTARAISLQKQAAQVFEELGTYMGDFYSHRKRQFIAWKGFDDEEWQWEAKFRKERNEQAINLAVARAALSGQIKRFYSNDLKRWVLWDGNHEEAWNKEKEFRDKRDQQALDLALTRAALSGQIKKFYSNDLKRWVLWDGTHEEAWNKEKKFREDRDKQALDLALTRAALSGQIKQFYSNELKRWVLMDGQHEESWKKEQKFRKERDEQIEEARRMLAVARGKMSGQIFDERQHQLFVAALMGQRGMDSTKAFPDLGRVSPDLPESNIYQQLPGSTQQELIDIELRRQAGIDRYTRPGDESLPDEVRTSLRGSRQRAESYEHQVQDAALQTASTIISAWDKVTEHTDTMVDNVIAAFAQTAINVTDILLNLQRASAAASASSAATGLTGTLSKFGAYGAIAAGVVALGSTIYSLADQRNDDRQQRNRLQSSRPVSIVRR